MSNNKRLLAAGGILGCLVLLLCIGVAALAGFAYYTNVSAMRPVDRIAYVDNQLNIQIADGQGQHHVAITSDASGSQKAYLFPTWSPDSQRLAFVEVSGDQNGQTGKITVAPLAGGNTTTIYQSSTEPPFYTYWSPDSREISFLIQTSNAQALMVGPADGKSQPHQIVTGSPLFWSWAPDASSILLHVGGTTQDSKDAHLALVRPNSGASEQTLPGGPGNFQTPQFAPDGAHILYAGGSGAGQDGLFLAGASGGNPRSIQKYDGSIAFTWSPDGKRIASIVTPTDAQLPVYGPLAVSGADGQDRKEITQDPVMAFFWAPNSQMLVYLTLVSTNNNGSGSGSGCLNCTNPTTVSLPAQQTAPIHLQWNLATLDDGKTRTLTTFVPTDDLISLLPFFDQYTRSMTFWSPDSKHFVYALADNSTTGSIWVMDMQPGAKPRRIGDGTLAVWSWK